MLSIIACIDSENGIGKSGSIPWSLSPDLKYFARVTIGSVIIMGRRTWESIGSKPLAKRVNIVVSSRSSEIHNAFVCTSPHQALKMAQTYAMPVFAIGGHAIYRELIPHANRIYLTRIINHSYQCDTFLPEFDPALYTIEQSDILTHHDISYIHELYKT